MSLNYWLKPELAANCVFVTWCFSTAYRYCVCDEDVGETHSDRARRDASPSALWSPSLHHHHHHPAAVDERPVCCSENTADEINKPLQGNNTHFHPASSVTCLFLSDGCGVCAQSYAANQIRSLSDSPGCCLVTEPAASYFSLWQAGWQEKKTPAGLHTGRHHH